MIIIASDHRGYLLKEDLKTFFNQENIITIDVGAYSKEPVDYPDIVKLANAKVLEDKNNVGIYICGSGIGVSLAANRNPKIRAALCSNENMAMLARKHNDANVLCIGANFTKKKKAIKMIKLFLTTAFEGGRHARRLKKISGDK
ncbi:MAG: ribose 5-phosphate isomerase B [Clostridia bacterium]|nr:ribose 5-phosphate isomerase B [Clostridia bacterium]